MNEPTTTNDQHDDHGFAHVMSPKLLLAVFFALIFLTYLTVYVSAELELGEYELMASMGIATVKAALVVFIFMHVWFDKALNKILFFFSFGFVALFMGFVLTDKYEYEPDVKSWTFDQIREEKAKQPVAVPATTPKSNKPKTD